jgi:hypothetical protein
MHKEPELLVGFPILVSLLDCCRIKIEKEKTAMTEQKASPKSTQGAFKASQSTHKQGGEVAEEAAQQQNKMV